MEFAEIDELRWISLREMKMRFVETSEDEIR